MTSTTLPGANRSEQSGAADVPDSGDTRAEFQALLSGCGLYDLSSRAKIAVTGGDRVRWLNGMVSNNVRDLAPGHGVYAFMLNAQGRIQADLYIFQRGDSLLVDTERGQREKVLQLFDHYIIADDVEIADVSDKLTALGLAGPESRHVLERAGISVPDLAPLELCSPKCDCACGCLQCTVVNGDNVNGDNARGAAAGTSYEIWLAPDQQKSTWDALVAAGAAVVGAGALELRRINFAIPRYGVDIRERDLPQETGQTRALNFTKGCYLGQEIVERIRSRGAVHRQFTAFMVEGALPEAGTKILAGENVEEKEVGEVTSSAILPLPGGDRPVALGYLRREAAGKDLRAGTSKLKPASLPIT
jgi:folate-binding protein YgfZ